MDKKTIHDQQLGAVCYDDSMDWYEASVATSYGSVTVSLDCDEYATTEELIADLRSFCCGLERVVELAFANIRETMVPLKNECWLDDGEQPISAAELVAAVKSEEISITLNKGGLAEMFFGDGDLFGGHSIVVWHQEDGTVAGAHLAG